MLKLGLKRRRENFVKFIVQFSNTNSVVQYRGGWYTSTKGIPTLVLLLTSFMEHVKWLLETKLLKAQEVTRYNQLLCRKRYLDDIFMAWKGTIRQFNQFFSSLNTIGSLFGIQFQGSYDKKIEFLDILIDISSGVIKTKLFVQTNGLANLFESEELSKPLCVLVCSVQFRRAVVICLDPSDRLEAVNYMNDKFVKCGCREEELNSAKKSALSLYYRFRRS